jgi:hypothetical protein
VKPQREQLRNLEARDPEGVPAKDAEWVMAYGSGTLRRAIEENMAWRELYLHERTAFEVGYGFIPARASRLALGKPLAEGDDPATTETLWWARVLRWRAARDKRDAAVTVTYAILDGEDNPTAEGIALIYEPVTRLDWLPADRVLLAFTADETGTRNPC